MGFKIIYPCTKNTQQIFTFKNQIFMLFLIKKMKKINRRLNTILLIIFLLLEAAFAQDFDIHDYIPDCESGSFKIDEKLYLKVEKATFKLPFYNWYRYKIETPYNTSAQVFAWKSSKEKIELYVHISSISDSTKNKYMLVTFDSTKCTVEKLSGPPIDIPSDFVLNTAEISKQGALYRKNPGKKGSIEGGLKKGTEVFFSGKITQYETIEGASDFWYSIKDPEDENFENSSERWVFGSDISFPGYAKVSAQALGIPTPEWKSDTESSGPDIKYGDIREISVKPVLPGSKIKPEGEKYSSTYTYSNPFDDRTISSCDDFYDYYIVQIPGMPYRFIRDGYSNDERTVKYWVIKAEDGKESDISEKIDGIIIRSFQYNGEYYLATVKYADTTDDNHITLNLYDSDLNLVRSQYTELPPTPYMYPYVTSVGIYDGMIYIASEPQEK